MSYDDENPNYRPRIRSARTIAQQAAANATRADLAGRDSINVPTEMMRLRLERLDKEREEMARRLDLLAKFGIDDYEDGAVVRFDKKLGYSDKAYSFAAIKCGEFWFVTGKCRPTAGSMTWDMLVSWLADGIPTTELWLVSEYTNLVSA